MPKLMFTYKGTPSDIRYIVTDAFATIGRDVVYWVLQKLPMDRSAFLWNNFGRQELATALLDHGYSDGEELHDNLVCQIDEFTSEDAEQLDEWLRRIE